MAIINSYPNNSDEYIGAEEVMRWHHGRTSGVYGGTGNAAVTAVQNSMAVSVAPGIGWITDAGGNGICWWFSSAVELSIDAAEVTGTLDRIDRIIVEWKTTDYADKPELKVLKGTDSSTAVAPALTNNSTTRQISLAQVSIPAGTTSLTSLNITDERMDSTVCGIVTETVTADTSMIAAQYEEALAELLDAIAQAWAGEISDGSITMSKLAPATVGELQDGLVPYDKAITLTPAEQKQAKDNIDAVGSWVKLWENASTNDFAAQTIPLDLSAYKEIRIWYDYKTTRPPTFVAYTQVGIGFSLITNFIGSYVPDFTERPGTVSTTGISFQDSRGKTATSGNAAPVVNNSNNVPIIIEGVLA